MAMKTLEGRLSGPLTILEDTSFHGKLEGDLRVAPGVVCLVHGMVAGDLDVGAGSVVELRGMVAGSATNRGRLQVYGVVRGFIDDQGDGQTTMVDRGRRVGT
jgi:cytoskeletal protein CcmA (bactofilin family)